MRRKPDNSPTNRPFDTTPRSVDKEENVSIDDEGTDRSLEALEMLMSAQERMKGIVECASALNRLMAEAADKDNMPFPIPLLPAGFTKGMQMASALSTQMPKGMARVKESEMAPPQANLSNAEAYLRLEGLIQTRGFITNEDLREVLSLSSIQATFRLKQWLADRYVVQRGQRRGARYVAGPRWPPKS